jgi:hypothetical protein
MDPTPLAHGIVQRHLRAGWWGLLVFLVLGAALEALHAFKVGAYLDVGNDTRRLMWRLAHAHGTLLALVNVGYALTVRGGYTSSSTGTLASRCLLAALVLIPAGFFAGGVVVHGGDPGIGVLLVPAGAVALAVGVASVARAVS